MIEIAQFEEVTQIRMSRVIDGVPIYWVSAYLVDGLLIDTGCSYTAEEIIQDIFGGEHNFAQITNGQYTTENLVRSVLEL